jgi:O-antigen/teichoic acid export membrane protein
LVTRPGCAYKRKVASDADAHRHIVRGGGSAAVGYVIRFGARLLFLFVAARLFGVALFGAYSLAVAATELAVAVGGLGMKRYLFRLLEERPPERPPESVVLDAACLVGAASLTLAGAMMAAVLLLPDGLLAPNTALAILVVAPMVAGQALLDLFLAATRWKQKMRYEVAARSLVEPYVAIAAAIAAYGAGFDQIGLLVSYWAGTLAALAYALFGFRRCYDALVPARYRLSLRRLRTIVRSTAMPTLTDLAGALFARLDLYLVGLFLGEAPAGVYNLARQMSTPARQVRQSFDGMLTPAIARTLAVKGPVETGAAIASAARLILTLQLVTLVGMIAIGQPLLAWFGPAFAAGYWAMVALVAAETILGAFGVSDLILLYRRPALTVGITSMSIAVNLVAAWLLIGPYGLTGAALSVLVAVAAGALLRRQLLAALFGITVPLTYSVGPIVAAILGIAGTVMVLNAPVDVAGGWLHAAALAAGLGLYAASLKAWLVLTGDRLELVKFTTG